jgi:hypothetical protein
MKGKAALIVGLATGYVLGTRDGRGRYQQIKTQANRLMQDPRVQEKATQAQELVKEKAPLVKGKVSDATHKATSKVSTSSNGSASVPKSATDTLTADAPIADTTTDISSPSTAPVHSDHSDHSADQVDDDAIIITAPSPSPLAPGPTPDTSTNPEGDLRD